MLIFSLNPWIRTFDFFTIFPSQLFSFHNYMVLIGILDQQMVMICVMKWHLWNNDIFWVSDRHGESISSMNKRNIRDHRFVRDSEGIRSHMPRKIIQCDWIIERVKDEWILWRNTTWLKSASKSTIINICNWCLNRI